jgi:hypothetical protein
MSDALEKAIIELVVTGSGTVSQQANKVEADLTSAERAGKRAEGAATSAEEAAKRAEQATENLTRQAELALHRLASAAHLLHHMAERFGAGEDFSILSGAAGEGLSVGAHTARLLTPFLGPLALPVAAAAGIGTGVMAAREGFENQDKRREEEARALARHLAQELEQRRALDLRGILEDQAALSQLGARVGGVRVK